MNLITPAKRRAAAALVREGFPVSLARDVDTQKAVDNPEPYGNSLAHINDGGVFYNGYRPDADAVMKNGHTRNSIHTLEDGIFTRGVLIDLPRLKGVPYPEPGVAVTVQDIEAWEKMAGVRVKLVPILQCRAADLGCRATGVGKRPGIYGQPFAAIQKFVQCRQEARTRAARCMKARLDRRPPRTALSTGHVTTYGFRCRGGGGVVPQE